MNCFEITAMLVLACAFLSFIPILVLESEVRDLKRKIASQEKAK